MEAEEEDEGPRLSLHSLRSGLLAHPQINAHSAHSSYCHLCNCIAFDLEDEDDEEEEGHGAPSRAVQCVRCRNTFCLRCISTLIEGQQHGHGEEHTKAALASFVRVAPRRWKCLVCTGQCPCVRPQPAAASSSTDADELPPILMGNPVIARSDSRHKLWVAEHYDNRQGQRRLLPLLLLPPRCPLLTQQRVVPMAGTTRSRSAAR